jgi:hypothetical protein
MSEIQFWVNRKEKTVRIEVGPFRNVKYVHWFTREFATEIDAEAMLRLIHDGMNERVLAIRRDAYELGYKHGRAKQKRSERVYGCINTEVEP